MEEEELGSPFSFTCFFCGRCIAAAVGFGCWMAEMCVCTGRELKSMSSITLSIDVWGEESTGDGNKMDEWRRSGVEREKDGMNTDWPAMKVLCAIASPSP